MISLPRRPAAIVALGVVGIVLILLATLFSRYLATNLSQSLTETNEALVGGKLKGELPSGEHALTFRGRTNSGQMVADSTTFTVGEGAPEPSPTPTPYPFLEPDGVYESDRPLGAAPQAGMVIVPKNYLVGANPATIPPAPAQPTLEIVATPGETEPVTFLIRATQPLTEVHIEISDLTAGIKTIPSSSVTARRVVRTPMRRYYSLPPIPENLHIVNRFLPRWQELAMAAGSFREAWLSVAVPTNQSAGTYTGTVTVSHSDGSRSIPLQVRVLPFALQEHPTKQLGMYYDTPAHLNTEAKRAEALREYQDLHDHGVKHLQTMAIRFTRNQQSGVITWNFNEIREGLGLMRQAGFEGATIRINSGLLTLAGLLGHNVTPDSDGQWPDGASLGNGPDDPNGDPQFWQLAQQAVQQFVQLENEYPDFRLVLYHMDEVFNNNKLPLYIRLSKAVRQVPQAELAINIHTQNNAADELRQQIDPYVDIRIYHGYTFSQWLGRLDNTMAAMEQEVAQAGDEAWFYHNSIGTYHTALWSYLINGPYLAFGPFAVHTPWGHQKWHGDSPFNDTDHASHDFGFALPAGPDSPELIPTRIYEALREGGDFVRLIATLEQAIAAAQTSKPQQAAAAEQFLQELRQSVRTQPLIPPAPPWPTGTKQSSPFLNGLATSFSASDLRVLRQQIIDWILLLES